MFRKLKKSFARKRKNTMAYGGIGRYGPYAGVNHKLNNGLNLKASVGTLGKKVGAKYGKGRSSFSVDHNLTTGRTKVKVRSKKKRAGFFF